MLRRHDETFDSARVAHGPCRLLERLAAPRRRSRWNDAAALRERIGNAFRDGIGVRRRNRQRDRIGRNVGCDRNRRFVGSGARRDLRIESQSVSAPKMDEGAYRDRPRVGRQRRARDRLRQDRYVRADGLREVGVDRERRSDCCEGVEHGRREGGLPQLPRSIQVEVQSRDADATDSGRVR